MRILHLVAIAVTCGDSLSSAIAQRASPNLKLDLLEYIESHAPVDDTPEQALEFLKTDAIFHQKFPEVGKALAVRALGPGLDPSLWVTHVATSCILCMTGCLLGFGVHWIAGTQDPTTHRYHGGTVVDNSLYRSITVCATSCYFKDSCTTQEAGTWQAQQDLSGMQTDAKREIVA